MPNDYSPKMEVVKNKCYRRKLLPDHTSKLNRSVNKITSTKGKETLPDRDKGKKEQDNNKRKSLQMNDEAPIRQKQLKREKIESKDKILDSKKLHTSNSNSKKKGTVKKSVFEDEERKKISQRPSVKKEKLLTNAHAHSKGNIRKRKSIQNKDDDGDQGNVYSSQSVDPVVKYKNKVMKQDSGPSPVKMKKEEKELKNTKLKKSTKVNSRKKSSTGKMTSHKKPKGKEKLAEMPAPIPEIDTNDPMALLMMMEGGHGKQLECLYRSESETPSANLNLPGKVGRANDHPLEEIHNSDDSDWEDVKDYTLPPEEERSQIPSGPVEITLDMPDILNKKRKKKQFDWQEHLQKQMRKFKREVAINIHKAHILCLLAHGLRQNSILNDETVKGLTLSLVPTYLIKSAKTCLSTERVVDSALSWYRKTFPLDQISYTSGGKLVSGDAIADVIAKSFIEDARLWVYVFIVVLRTLGLSVRLVLSLQPIPFKVSESANVASSSASKAPGSSQGVKSTSKASSVASHSKASANKSTKQSSSLASPSKKLSSSLPSCPKLPSLSVSPVSSKPSGISSTSASSSKPSSSSSSKAAKTSKVSSSSSSSAAAAALHRSPSVRRSSLEARMKSKKNLKEESDEEDVTDGKDKMKSDKKSMRKKGKDVTKKVKSCSDEQENSDSDFEITSPYFGHNRQELKVKSNRKILSDDDEDGRAHDFWLEIFMQGKKQWNCFDCFKNVYNKPYSLEIRATQPVRYVVAFKNDNGVKDVTARYAKQWFSQTRKMRVNSDWLEETFGLFGKTTYGETVMEEDQIKSQLMVRPMPSSISDFKSHPLYALRRHLLKFEAIYPETSIPLGYVRKEPVYARECVRTLHSRDNWLKEGRLVRLKEEPYKMVKSRPKWNKPKENPEELDLELYGEWQTELYIPPPAFNGKVPKNEYGNVELFKPWMLPTGTVQLKLQGLQRVAKKLNIDVAPAMVGWDHHSGHAHPVFDGFIACEEFADALLDAWDEDQEIQQQKEDEKRDKRVYGNWRLLIRGMLIKERLKIKFLQDPLLMEMEEIQASQSSSIPSESTAAGPSSKTPPAEHKVVGGVKTTEREGKKKTSDPENEKKNDPESNTKPSASEDEKKNDPEGKTKASAPGGKTKASAPKGKRKTSESDCKKKGHSAVDEKGDVSDSDEFVTDDKASNTSTIKEKALVKKGRPRRVCVGGRGGVGRRKKGTD